MDRRRTDHRVEPYVALPARLAHDASAGKGVDVALAVDFVRLAMQRAYDVGVMFSSDTDLLPALETVTEQALARVEVAAWSNTFRLRFGGTTRPWCHHLTARDYEAVMDPTDYTKPSPPARRAQEETGR